MQIWRFRKGVHKLMRDITVATSISFIVSMVSSQKHPLTLRLLLGRMAIPSFHSRTWTMLQAPPTCAVRVGLAASLTLPPLPGSPTATAGVTSTFWWLGTGAAEENEFKCTNLLFGDTHHIFFSQVRDLLLKSRLKYHSYHMACLEILYLYLCFSEYEPYWL